jgi:predicted ATP-binding protein involved in virulence
VSATAQTSQSSTPTSPAALSNAQRELEKEADGVKRETDALRLELRMRKLIDEAKAGRELITSQRREMESADAQLEAEKKNTASLELTKTLAEKQIEHLLKATGALNEAIDFKSESILVLEKRNAELKRDASKNRKRAFWATVAAAIATGLLIMK